MYFVGSGRPLTDALTLVNIRNQLARTTPASFERGSRPTMDASAHPPAVGRGRRCLNGQLLICLLWLWRIAPATETWYPTP
jgi:hypothetical protein